MRLVVQYPLSDAITAILSTQPESLLSRCHAQRKHKRKDHCPCALPFQPQQRSASKFSLQYLTDLLIKYAPYRKLRSANINILVVPRYKLKTFRQRAFSCSNFPNALE